MKASKGAYIHGLRIKQQVPWQRSTFVTVRCIFCIGPEGYLGKYPSSAELPFAFSGLPDLKDYATDETRASTIQNFIQLSFLILIARNRDFVKSNGARKPFF